jgi:hypothetical protein
LNPKDFAFYCLENGNSLNECLLKYFKHHAYDRFSRHDEWLEFEEKQRQDECVIKNVYSQAKGG